MMIPITRKEKYINEIVGDGNTAPETPQTREELFFADILGEVVAPSPITRAEKYLAKIANKYSGELPEPVTGIERFLARAAGMDVTIPTPITREEIFWAAYAGVEIEIEGVPPLTFKSNGANLSDYRIYGNTVNGESVGNLVESGEHTGEYRVPVTVTNGTDTETTNLYLPEQIKMVGDEAEYIDFKEQKQHKVRKNLIDFNWLWDYEQRVPAGVVGNFFHYIELVLNPNTTYNVSSDYPYSFDSNTTAFIVVNSETEINTNNGGVFGSRSVTTAQDGILKIARRISGNNSAMIPNRSELELEEKHIQVEKGSIATEYESYIQDTELDVTLPALPTLSGTNTLSVETTVQPSKVMIKTGKFGTHKVRYYDSDGTFLSAEDVKDGTNAQGFTPTKASTVQYNYTFVGWSTTKGSTTAETGVLNDITADKSLYAVFSQSLKTFTVYFYNDSTLLQTAENVQYGGTATYTGTTPTSSQTGYIFDGWNPSNTNITADTSCYAQFVDEDMYESISDTWSEIIANVSNGTYSTKYHIGDTKKIDLGTEGEVIMTIVGIDTDDLADNSGKAPITWISKQLLKTIHRMNPQKQSGTSGTGTLGGWEACEMRNYLINTIKPLMPSEVRNALKTVKKYSRIYNTSETEVNNVVSNDDIWIPSMREMNFTGYETSGVTYSTAFPDNASRIKHKVGGPAAWWWLRSASNTNNFRVVNNDGSNFYGIAYNSGGVAVGFCT